MNVRVSWSVSNDPIADKLKWFLSKCAVKSLDDQARISINFGKNIYISLIFDSNNLSELNRRISRQSKTYILNININLNFKLKLFFIHFHDL